MSSNTLTRKKSYKTSKNCINFLKSKFSPYPLKTLLTYNSIFTPNDRNTPSFKCSLNNEYEN